MNQERFKSRCHDCIHIEVCKNYNGEAYVACLSYMPCTECVAAYVEELKSAIEELQEIIDDEKRKGDIVGLRPVQPHTGIVIREPD